MQCSFKQKSEHNVRQWSFKSLVILEITLQGILKKWKQLAYTLEKSALDDSSAYISHTKCRCADDLI